LVSDGEAGLWVALSDWAWEVESKNKTKGKVKSLGQECPSQTSNRIKTASGKYLCASLCSFNVTKLSGGSNNSM
jgi:hypothetical protein